MTVIPMLSSRSTLKLAWRQVEKSESAGVPGA